MIWTIIAAGVAIFLVVQHRMVEDAFAMIGITLPGGWRWIAIAALVLMVAATLGAAYYN